MCERELAAVRARTNAYLSTGDVEAVLGEQASSAAVALMTAALPSSSFRGLGRSPCHAAHVLGWFHYTRFAAIEGPHRLSELARALVLFEANSSTTGLPPLVDRLLGDEPDADFRTECASELVSYGDRRDDRYALAAGIGLLDRSQHEATDPVDQGWHLADLGHAQNALFEHTDLDEDLEASIGSAERAVTVLGGHRFNAVPLMNLSAAYLDRHRRTGDTADLQRSVDRGEQAVRALPPDTKHRAQPLTTLGSAYRRLYERTGVTAHIDAAIERVRSALSASDTGDPRVADRRSNLARYHLVRYQRLGRLDDLEASIAAARQARTDTDDPATQALCDADLAQAHLRRYRHTRGLSDLDAALEHGERAHVQRPDDEIVLGTLAAVYADRSVGTRRGEDLSAAIELGERALALSRGPAHRALCHDNLSGFHHTRYQVLGEAVDLDCAVDHVRRAVDESPGPTGAGYLANLVVALIRRYEQIGDPDDVHAALESGHRALDATAPPDPEHTRCLANLGVVYRTRHELTGDPTDLESGVDLAARALAATPDDDPDLPHRLWNMAYGPSARFRRAGDPSMQRSAIEYATKAIAALPEESHDRATYLANLGDMHRSLFVDGGRADPTDLDIAVDLAERSVAATAQGDPRRGGHLATLGASYASRFRAGGNTTDLDAAIEAGEQALALAPPGHPRRAGALADLAFAHTLGPERPLTDVTCAAAARLDGEVTGLTNSPTMDRVRAQRGVGHALARWGATADAARRYRLAVHELRAVAPRELTRAEQEYRLAWHHGLVGEAVAAQLGAGDRESAVEIAEAGRGVLLWSELEASRSGAGAVTEAPRFADLSAAGDQGAVVLVVPAAARSSALVLHHGQVDVVTLNGLTIATLLERGRALVDVTGVSSPAGSLARGRTVPEILAWLWDVAAGPILDALGHHAAPRAGQPWPRVWWVPTGLASAFPWHAAGKPGGPSVIDRVVSSYAPTIRALQHSRARPRATARRQLTTAVSNTPGHHELPDLLGTAGEARALHPDGPDGCLLVDAEATTSAVSAALESTTWAHLACHARTDPMTPSRGGLVLHDGTLTVTDIGDLHPESAELAYLSGCGTARGLGRGVDEVIHISSAFALAGYRHVIATLWAVDDAVAADAARRFYEALPDSPAADTAAHALHTLAHGLRAAHPDRPDLWSPFIHSGP